VSTGEAALPAGAALPRVASPRRRREPTVAFWGLMVFTFVLFVAPQNYVPGLAALGPAQLAVVVALIAYLANRAQTGQRFTVMTPPLRWSLALLGAAVLSLPTSFWPGGSVTVMVDLLGKSLVIFFLIANVVRSESRARLLIGSILAWGTLAAVVAIRNFLSGDLEMAGLRISGYESPLARNPNDLALTLNILLGLAIGLYATLRTRRARLVLAAAMAVMGLGVVVSFSRSGFVTFAAMLAYWTVRSVRQRGARVVAVLLPIVLVVAILLPRDYSARLATISDIEADPTGSAAERWQTMVFALHLIEEFPVFGVGIGNNVHISVARKGPAMDAHNAYLKVGAELGILGMIAYVGLVMAALRSAHTAERLLRKRPEQRGLLALVRGVALGLVAFAVGACFSPIPYHFYFFYPAGLAVALEVMARRAAAAPAVPAGR
jgi:putative inorganic carbon (hco3(-)) transporter